MENNCILKEIRRETLPSLSSLTTCNLLKVKNCIEIYFARRQDNSSPTRPGAGLGEGVGGGEEILRQIGTSTTEPRCQEQV